MSNTIDDLDVEALISRLAGPLLPPDRVAFRQAAEDALARVPCWGEGAVYRTVAALQRQFLNPPTFGQAQWDVTQERPVELKRRHAPSRKFQAEALKNASRG